MTELIGRDSSAVEAILFEQAEPLIRRIVRWRLGPAASSQDLEDVTGDILLELLSRIDSLRRGESQPIADFSAYTAVTAHHGCDRYLRTRFPKRHRLSTRVRYLLETSAEYAVWESRPGELACGYARLEGGPVKSDLEPGWASQIPLAANASEATAVAAALSHAGGALALADLVNAVAQLLNVHDEFTTFDQTKIAATMPDPDSRLDHRRALEQLWQEITLLPRPQRVALLLNLRDDEGACALTSLPATNIASMREIAQVLEIPAEELARLWRSLPLTDREIAMRLDISRQQVINLRKAARQRLGRRVTGNMRAKLPSK